MFPTNLDSFTTIQAGEALDAPAHVALTNQVNSAVVALENKVGEDNSAVVTSIDYLVKNASSIDPGHKHTLANGAIGLNAPEGFLINGLIVPSVTSNNLTVAIKGMDGSDSSATNPVYCRIGGVVRSLTSALSITKNAGTNWFNAGSAELATKEIDYFVYLCWDTSTNLIKIGYSRIPGAHLIASSDFTLGDPTAEKCILIDSANNNDEVVNVGRFAATLSAGGGYTWSVPTFTASNLIQRPIYETGWNSWTPLVSATESMTWNNSVTAQYYYKLSGEIIFYDVYAQGTTGGSASYGLMLTLPFTPPAGKIGYSGCSGRDGGGSIACANETPGNENHFTCRKYDGGNWGIGDNRAMFAKIFLPLN